MTCLVAHLPVQPGYHSLSFLYQLAGLGNKVCYPPPGAAKEREEDYILAAPDCWRRDYYQPGGVWDRFPLPFRDPPAADYQKVDES